MNRRHAIGALVGGAAALPLLSARPASAKAPALTPLAPGAHKPVPLPFDPAKLRGLSEKLVSSHHANNYTGAVKNLNAVELELDKLPKDAPGFRVSGLRERELTYANSVLLHERYFESLGGDGKPAGAFAKALATQFGSAAKWEAQLRATAMSLGGGSGWVVIAYGTRTSDLRIVGSGGHASMLAASTPILVLDMFEHAYALDYGAAHAKYLDAWFANLDWAALDRRWQALAT